ncbi:MAG: hypothetical protein GEU73_00225 [Chloroflexi bacterium]|nr:hypothetical protein [Chloroflexota bacterium]
MGMSGKDKGDAIGLPARERIGVSTLKGISVLFEDDIHDLACWALKMNEGKDKGNNSRSRHTVYGLAGIYSVAAHMSRDEIVHVLEDHGLPIEATIEHDEDAT